MKRFRAIALAIVLALGVSVGVRAADGVDGNGVSSKGLVVSPAGEATIWTDRSEYRVGEAVKIGFRSPVDGFASVYDLSPNGTSQLIWPRGGAASRIKAGVVYSIPERGQTVTASEPLGVESLVLVVTKDKPAFNFSFNFSFGGSSDSNDPASRGLVIGGGDRVPDGTFSARCSFRVMASQTNPTLRISGGMGARLFIDGNDYGTVGASQLTLEPGRHQVVALFPGMKAEVKDFTMRFDATYDWRLRFQPSR